jgi:pimeloyl-ACP methyl ester carboxylesterase
MNAITRVALTLAVLAGCSSDGTVVTVGPPSGPHPLYGPGPSTALIPYPSNRYAKADTTTATGLRVSIDATTTADPTISTSSDAGVEQLANAVATINESDGFSTVGGVFATFTDDLDPSSFTLTPDQYTQPGTPMALVDVDDSSPEKGTARGLVPRYVSSTNDPDATVADFLLVAEPSTPLRPKTKYAYVITDAVRTATGTHLVPSPDTFSLVTGTAEGAYGDSVRAALPIVQTATGIDPSHVTLATVFTTETVHDTLVAVAQDRRAAPRPMQSDTLVVNEMGAGAGDNRVRFAGHFPAPDFRAPKPDSKWHIGSDGKPSLQSTASLEFFLAFSDRTFSGPRPVAIFQHGLGSDKDSTWGTADRLKALNVAVIGIDAPEHGSRATPPYPPGQTDLVKATSAFFGLDLNKGSFDLGIARDNFRQMACDQLDMLRFIQTLGTLDVLPLDAPDGKPDIDPTRIIYLGHSFGSVMAATFESLAPEVSGSVWNVGGAGFALLFEDSPLFGILTKGLTPAGTTKGQLARFFAMIQGVVDPGDAVNYAHYVTTEGLPGVPAWKPKDVLLEEVIGDNIVPNSSAERLARAAGLAQVQPVVKAIGGLDAVAAPASGNLPSGATGGVFQFDHADGMPVNHGGLIFTNDAINQYTKFFAASLAGGHGTVVNPFASP